MKNKTSQSGKHAQHQASGVFTWNRHERVSNRYGSFTMSDEYEAVVLFDRQRIEALVGKRVRITCKVTKTRQSEHIGDLFLGVFPSTPAVGEVVELGVGTLRLENDEQSQTPSIVLEPGDGRDELWMDPDKLFRLHEQNVEVTIEQTTDDFTPLTAKWVNAN